jgi:hypothetical protein
MIVVFKCDILTLANGYYQKLGKLIWRFVFKRPRDENFERCRLVAIIPTKHTALFSCFGKQNNATLSKSLF